MKKKIDIKVIIERKFDLQNSTDVYEAYKKFFSGKTGDDRPSKEEVVWFLTASRESISNVTARNLLCNGYLNVADLVRFDLLDILYRQRAIKVIISNHENPLPTTDKELMEILDLLKGDKAYNFVSQLLSVSPDCGGLAKYREFIDKFFDKMLSIVKLSQDCVLDSMYYIPSSFILNYLKQNLLSHGMFRGACRRVASYIDRNCIPDQVIGDILPFISTAPYAGEQFPYNKELGMDKIIASLASLFRWGDEAKISKPIRRKAYNLFIKPYIDNNKTLVSFIKECIILNMSERIFNPKPLSAKTMYQFASLFTPAQDDIKVFELLHSTLQRELTISSAMEYYANVKTRLKHQVSKEFILKQYEIGTNESYMCLNNPCINDLSFWEGIQAINKNLYGDNLIATGLAYNDSFLQNFTPKIEDAEAYRKWSNKISWRAISSSKNLTIEFVKLFKDKINPNHLEDNLISQMTNEDIVEIYTNKNGILDTPLKILRLNKTLKPNLILAIANSSRNGFGYTYRNDNKLLSHIKLNDLVAALS